MNKGSLSRATAAKFESTTNKCKVSQFESIVNISVASHDGLQPGLYRNRRNMNSEFCVFSYTGNRDIFDITVSHLFHPI